MLHCVLFRRFVEPQLVQSSLQLGRRGRPGRSLCSGPRRARSRHAHVRRCAALGGDGAGIPVDFRTGYRTLPGARFARRRRAGRQQDNQQKPNYSHSMVAGGLDEMS